MKSWVVLRQVIGWIIVAIGGSAFITPTFMLNSNIRDFSLADIVGMDGYRYIPVWLIGGLFLIFLGFHMMGEQKGDEETRK